MHKHVRAKHAITCIYWLQHAIVQIIIITSSITHIKSKMAKKTASAAETGGDGQALSGIYKLCNRNVNVA